MAALDQQAARTPRTASPALGIAGSLALIAVAVAVPKLFHWQVNALHRAPLSVRWIRGWVAAPSPPWRSRSSPHAGHRAPGSAASLRWARLPAASFSGAALWGVVVGDG